MSYKIYKIKDIGEVVSGTTPSTNNESYWNGNIKWITPAELIDGHNWYLYDTNRKITEKAFKDCNLRMLSRGTILLTSRAPIGKVAIVGEEMCTNQGFKSIICNPNYVNSEYLYFWLLSKKDYLNHLGRGATFKEISKSIVENIEVPLPSLEIQNKIVEILKKALNLIDKRKAQIEALDQLTQSVFLEMFGDLRTNQKGWKIVELSEVVQVDANLVDDITNYVNYPLVGIDNIEKNTGNLINIKTVGESDVKGSKYFFSREHILYSKIRPYLNKVASPSFEGLCSTDAYPLKINKEKANKQFILNILRSKDFVSYAVKHSKGANIPRIDQKQLLNYKTILPDLNTQNQFENIVKKIEIQKEIIKKSLRELENTFNSLMQRAFKGELFND